MRKIKFILTGILIVSIYNLIAQGNYQTIDSFETHNWHSPGWCDASVTSYSNEWATQGNTSLKLTNLESDLKITYYTTGCFNAISPSQIKFDICNASNVQQTFEIKVRDVSGTEHMLGNEIIVNANSTLTVIRANSFNFKNIVLVQKDYGDNLVTAYIDNIRCTFNGQEMLWDPCEDHIYWEGSGTAYNADYEVVNSEDITHQYASSGSSASIAMQWNTAGSAELKASSLNLNYENCWEFKFDIYRPLSTPNINIKLFISDGVQVDSTKVITVETPNKWITVTVPIISSNVCSRTINEIKIKAEVTGSGTLYFDNLKVGGYSPESTIINPNILGYVHSVNNYSTSMEGNNYNGISGAGTSPLATVTNIHDTTNYYTAPGSMKINYDLTNDGSYIYYYNTLKLNSQKSHVILYLKGGITNPGRIKLELHDENWNSGGGAYCYLSGLTTSWQQWIIPINTADWIPYNSFDPDNITEIVISLENGMLSSDNKLGAFYIDDIAFVDKTNELVPFSGEVYPESTEVKLNALGYPHLLNDYSKGVHINSFYGNVYIGGNKATIDQGLSTSQFNNDLPGLQINYDVSMGPDSYCYYSNTLRLNSDKKYLAVNLKGGVNNPEKIKIELHDLNWPESGSVYAYLNNIRSDQWQQYLIPIKSSVFNGNQTFDYSKISEVVFVVANNDVDSKVGSFFIDDLVFVDSSESLKPLIGISLPETDAVKVKNIGVPYSVDDFDGRVLNNNSIDRNFNDFIGYTGVWAQNMGTSEQSDSIEFSISSIEDSLGTAHSTPFSGKISYEFDTVNTSNRNVVYYSILSLKGAQGIFADIHDMDVLSLWIRSSANANPEDIVVSLKDSAFKKASCILTKISSMQWQQYNIPFSSLKADTGFDYSSVSEFNVEVNSELAVAQKGDILIDDIVLVDTNVCFNHASDFDFSKNEEFLDLLEKRTFKYFIDCFDKESGLVRDRASDPNLASVAATGWGLTVLPIGVDRGWISLNEAKGLVLKSLNTLWNTPQGTDTIGTSGYKGFYYHFLKINDGTRSGKSELSIIDTEKLLQGVLTCKQYFNDSLITALADSIYRRVEWPWFLDQRENVETNPHYNQFYLGWLPDLNKENNGIIGFGPDDGTFYWDYFTDETTLINLLAIGSTTYPVSKDVFYAWTRKQGRYNKRGITQSYFGSLFHYFFLHCWWNVKDKTDSLNLNFYNNAIQAGLANRDFCIEGKDYRGLNMSTYHENSWGLSACDPTSAGSQFYLGENGAPPNTRYDETGEIHESVDGTVPPYGGISMIGFCDDDGLMPVNYISNLVENYYKNTQLWTGYYGFRDSYSDTVYKKENASSCFPMYRNDHVSIDQGPLMVMIENYRTGLIRNTFMTNPEAKTAVKAIFSDVEAPVAPVADELSISVHTSNKEYIENFDGVSIVDLWGATSSGVYSYSVTDSIAGNESNCIRVDYNKQTGDEWAALLGEFSQNEDFSGYDSLRLKVYGELTFIIKVENAMSNGPEGRFTVSGNDWQVLSFCLNDDGSNTNVLKSINKFVIIPEPEKTGAGTFYIDDIELIQKGYRDAIFDYIPIEGDELIGNYLYNDGNGDPEYDSKYRWLISDEYGGNYSAILGATESTYQVKSSDAGKYIKFEVTPKSLAEPFTGSAVVSLPIRTSNYFDLHLNVPYVAQENNNYSGAACAKMALDFEGENSITQMQIQQYAISNNTMLNRNADFVDPLGMVQALNHFEIDRDYNYAQLVRNNRDEAYRDLCYWISNNIPLVPEKNMPTLVPTRGSFNNWMLVNGFQSSGNPHKESNYTLFGLYIKDPNITTGIGQDIYVQARVFGENYYLPINSSDQWNGKFVTVDEPPVNTNTLSVQPTQASISAPTTNELRYQAAESGLKNYHLYNNTEINVSLTDTKRGRIYFVDLPGYLDDYYIVTYEKDDAPVLAVIIDANSGALKEVSFSKSPDKNYYNIITGVLVSKSTIMNNNYSLNSFYPSNANVKIAVDEDNVSNTSLKRKQGTFTINPNPVNNSTQIKYKVENEGVVKVFIFDMTGKLVKEFSNVTKQIGENSFNLDLGGFENGLYNIQLCKDGVSESKKILIMK